MKSIRARAPASKTAAVRRVMQANVGSVTTPERSLRRALRREGLAFATGARPVQGLRCTVDIVLREHRICIFMDGCFWHACPKHCSMPKLNRSWWAEKLRSNVDRDKRQRASLRRNGWRVLRVWEHELVESDRVVRRILRAIEAAGAVAPGPARPTSDRSPATRPHARGRASARGGGSQRNQPVRARR